MIKIFVVLTALFLAVPAVAATYKWVDEKGTISYADELGKVPKKYRDKAKIIDEQASPVEIVESEGKPSGKEKAGSKEEGLQPLKGEKAAKPAFGGKDEETWRKEFAQLKGDIRTYEENLAATKARLTDTGTMSRNEYVSLQHTVKDLESRLNGLRQKLNALTEAADKANVPGGLR